MASIRKRGRVWHVQIRRKGHPSLTKSFQIRSDAERWARRIERGIDLGDSQCRPDCNEFPDLASLLRRYRDTVSFKKRGHSSEKWRLDALSRHWIGKRALHNLTPALLSEYRDERLKVVAEPSVLVELTLLRHCLQIAIDEWSVPLKANPVKQIRLPRASDARCRRLEVGELDALLHGCAQGRTPLLAPVIQFAIETGMRRGEIVSTTWDNIDLDKRTLHIPVTKNGHARTIPLTPTAIDVLQGLERTDERVFPITGNAVRLAWGRLKKRVGITDLRFHDLRHEAISRFFEMGLSVPEVALISGHRHPRMLFRYTHLKAENVGEKIRKVTGQPPLT